MHSLNALTQWVEKQAVIFKKTHFKNSGNIIAVDLNTLKIQDPAFLEFIVADFDIHRSNLANFIHFLNAQTGAQYFTQSHCFTVNRSLLLIEPNQPLNQPYQQTVLGQNLPNTFQTPWVKLAFTPSKTIKPFERNGETLQFDIEKIKFPLLIRNWKKGDRIQPLGMMGTKLISAILIDKKISIAQKKHTLVLVDAENTLLALIGHTIADPFKITNQTQAFLLVNTVH